MAEADDGFDCPECGNALPADARFCPECASALSEDGSVVDLEDPDDLPNDADTDLEGPDDLPDDVDTDFDVDVAELIDLYDDEDQVSLVEVDENGQRRASRRIRILSGLAVSIPIAPLALFLTSTVVELTLPTAALAFVLGWLVPATALSRASEPVVAFGRSLYLLALGTALIPVALLVGDAPTASGALGVEFGTLAAIAAAIAVLAFGLGRFVTAQARRGSRGRLGARADENED